MLEGFSSHRIKQIFQVCYHWRAIDIALIRSKALNMSKKNHFCLMISFSNHHYLYYFVHVFSIKASREVVEGLSLRRIQKRFQFCYHCRAINTVLICNITLNTSHIIG